jgi:hypothetical protein
LTLFCRKNFKGGKNSEYNSEGQSNSGVGVSPQAPGLKAPFVLHLDAGLKGLLFHGGGYSNATLGGYSNSNGGELQWWGTPNGGELWNRSKAPSGSREAVKILPGAARTEKNWEFWTTFRAGFGVQSHGNLHLKNQATFQGEL